MRPPESKIKSHIRQFYEQRYRGESGGARGLGGKPLAVELGYPPELIDSIPGETWEDFFPCGYVLSALDPKGGDRVLNLGCGAGVDSLLVKICARVEFQVVNLDTAFSALVKAKRAARSVSSGRGFEFICADGGSIPFEPGSFEWVILNGVFNLFPQKEELIEELHRVLKPGGIVAGADLCRKGILPGYFAEEPDAWAWCMSGAVTGEELTRAFQARGFTHLGMAAENMDEFFDRAVFTFRKNGFS
ncbi:MAG: methyltransferase domain-containing protein [Syntrophobacteraceae bacterium]|nr:methyltransferase domain-containing protein [Syntrophobacteraceae bacterium]